MHLSLGSLVVLASTVICSLVDARTTFELNPRSTATDVCGDVHDELIVSGAFGYKVPIGIVNKCICLSQIPVLLKTDPLIVTAVHRAGESAVKYALTDLVKKSKDHQTCRYPDHAEPVCKKGNPCGFECKDGFTAFPEKRPKECVCKAPHKVCNGVCGSSKTCPSGRPHYRREPARKRAFCGEGLTACGIYGWGSSGGDAWECVNTATDLESCGGCAIPFDALSPLGVDCTAIPGVADVACRAGICVVHRCVPGYKVSDSGTFCVTSSTLLEQN